MNDARQPKRSAPDALRLPAAPADATPAAAAVHYHRDVLLTGVYYRVLAHSIEKMFPSPELRQSCLAFVTDTIRRAEPQDPMEEMLISQMLLAHLRSLHMTFLSGGSQHTEDIGALAQHAERASNTYRRLMLALAEYRRPAHRSFTAIAQANVAQQQIVANGTTPERSLPPTGFAGFGDGRSEQRVPDRSPKQGGADGKS